MQDEFLRLQSLLNKTIVFITHDFDEALKLADRIAIMFNGGIEQIGKPEDIVLNPATDYVARFTSDVPRERVLRVGSVMDPPSDDEKVADQAVNAADRIENVVEYVLGQRLPVPVVRRRGHGGRRHAPGACSEGPLPLSGRAHLRPPFPSR